MRLWNTSKRICSLLNVGKLYLGIVAPYEADAQLGYLSKINYIDAVIAEDSDMLVFGAQVVLMKLDNTGNFEQLKLKDLGSVRVDNIESRVLFCRMESR